MVQICSKCSRANPGDASYCYNDGFVLGNGSRNGGPLAIGAQAFAQPFVFPDGRMCRNFDELALASQERWAATRDLFSKGYLEKFFGGLGRLDLVMAAQEAGKFPDPDRGLDQLLAKLPSDVLGSPQLAVETTEINLGQLKVGDAREFDIHLENQGMRLLYGSVSCGDAKNVWLTLGDVPGSTEKHFQFGHEQVIKVKVCGDRLRANNKPLEARLLVDSNGGRATINIKAQVAVIPFSEGVLAGSRSPRELAAKAKQNTREAAPLFENGSVQEWYRVNGWTYPVSGPAYSGLHAIQQFFEALGLVKPPVVEIDMRSMDLQGNPGDPLSFEIKVESAEKKPVYAHATSDQDWLQPGMAKLSGRTAIIPVSIPAVPRRPGQTLQANLRIQSNGDQRFDVPVNLAITGNAFSFDPGEAEPVPMAVSVESANPLDFAASPMPSSGVKANGHPSRSSKVKAATPPSIGKLIPSSAGPSASEGKAGAVETTPLWMHLAPAVLLGVAVLGVMVYDLVKPLRGVAGNDASGGPALPSGESRLILQFSDVRRGNFGLQIAHEPDPTNPDQLKRITYDDRGSGDNVIVKIDGFEPFFSTVGRDRTATIKPLGGGRIGQIYTVNFKEFKVEVEQRVELAQGASGQLDTCLIDYTITNKDSKTHEVGLRVLMDTYIGANDGVPFTIPGRKGFVDTMEDFSEKQIPDYIEAIENPETPSNLGTVVRMGLKHLQFGGAELEPIEKLRICKFPGTQTKWDWDREPMNKGSSKDSCVALYWATVKMNPGDSRHLGYTYGLSELSIGTGESPMALSAPASVRPNSEMLVTAYVWNVRKGSQVELELPAGLELAKGERAAKTIDESSADRVQVSWRVQTTKVGDYQIKAKVGRSVSRPMKIRVETRLF